MQILIIVALVILLIILLIINAKIKKAPKSITECIHNRYVHYTLNHSIFNKSEEAFFITLHYLVGNNAFIAPKIGLKDFLSVAGYSHERHSNFLRISQKHVDFLLFSPVTFAPICAIEIDGPTHNYEKTKRRDAFVEDTYHNAGLPLLRFKAQLIYDPVMVMDALSPYLKPYAERKEL